MNKQKLDSQISVSVISKVLNVKKFTNAFLNLFVNEFNIFTDFLIYIFGICLHICKSVLYLQNSFLILQFCFVFVDGVLYLQINSNPETNLSPNCRLN